MRIHRLRVRNYRALQDVTFKDLDALTVLFGPNGSGKSTVFDVFAFLNEAFTTGLRGAWDARNRMDGVRSRGSSGPVSFEISYRAPDFEGREKVVTYTLAVDQEGNRPVVVDERLRWSTAPGAGRPRDILSFQHGKGTVYDEQRGEYDHEDLAQPDLLAVSALGQFQSHPRVKALRDFVQGWYLSYISADGTRATPNAGPELHLSRTGDNLANVVQYLAEDHPEILERVFGKLGRRVPQVESVLPERLSDGRLLLRLKDRAFAEPVISRFASDGTLKLLAYLVVLNDPEPHAVIGIEELENQLHPKLLPVLADEIREASATTQMLVTTHSPEFLADIRPRELWAIRRGDDGYAKVQRASENQLVASMMREGANLGDLWSEGYLIEADPRDV